MTISGTTRIYAILGDPIGHVRTPISFNAYFAERGRDAICIPLQIPAEAFDTCLAGLKAMPNLDGLVVTAPHKAAVMRFCDTVEPGARLVGAVNTIRRTHDGGFAGAMLDGHGFVTGLQRQGHKVRGKSVFIVGAGGAASAIGFALAEAGAREVRFRNRTASRAMELAARIAAAFPHCATSVDTMPRHAEIAVNATPLGLQPGDPLPMELASLQPGTLVAEVIMKPAVTPLLVAAAAAGFATHVGQHMLDNQLDLMFDFLGLA